LSSPILLQPRPDNSIGHPTVATLVYATTTTLNAPPTNAPAITTTNSAITGSTITTSNNITAASNNITTVHGAVGPTNSRKGGKRGMVNYTSDEVKDRNFFPKHFRT
jgi:hypothetical protein